MLNRMWQIQGFIVERPATTAKTVIRHTAFAVLCFLVLQNTFNKRNVTPSVCGIFYAHWFAQWSGWIGYTTPARGIPVAVLLRF